MASFTPNPNFDRENSNPKDWAYHLGCLPQKHHIVFTKEDLVTFLKQHNVHVGPNFTELSRLPKFAMIGKLSESDSATIAATPAQQQQTTAPTSFVEPVASHQLESAPSSSNVVYTTSGDVFRPSRKVRQLPGGGSAQVTALFGGADEEDHPQPRRATQTPAPAPAPTPAPVVAPAAAPVAAPMDDFEPLGSAATRKVSGNVPQQQQHQLPQDDKAGVYEGVRNDAVMNNGFRPTRRVRVPGGTGGVSSISFY